MKPADGTYVWKHPYDSKELTKISSMCQDFDMCFYIIDVTEPRNKQLSYHLLEAQQSALESKGLFFVMANNNNDPEKLWNSISQYNTACRNQFTAYNTNNLHITEMPPRPSLPNLSSESMNLLKQNGITNVTTREMVNQEYGLAILTGDEKTSALYASVTNIEKEQQRQRQIDNEAYKQRIMALKEERAYREGNPSI